MYGQSPYFRPAMKRQRCLPTDDRKTIRAAVEATLMVKPPLINLSPAQRGFEQVKPGVWVKPHA